MKKFIIILISIFSFINVSAIPKTIERTDEDLGVNKKWTINSQNIGNVKKTPRVDASEKIYDFANVLNETDIQSLKSQMDDFILKTNMDIVIVLIDEKLSDYEIEDYAADFYDYNDFGLNYENYSGILLIRNVNSYNRFFNVYTFGQAQLYFDYDRCEEILDIIYEDIKNNNYLNGLAAFINSASTIYDRGLIPNRYIDDYGYVYAEEDDKIPFGIAFLVSGIITTVIMIILVKKNKMIKTATLANVYMDKNSIQYRNKVDHFLHSHTTSYVSSSSSGHGGGSSFSHSGSSGGGHGGGGGRHG